MSSADVSETKLSFLQKLAIKILKQGPVPNHVAFIMDGNRRWATKQNSEKHLGHEAGRDTLEKVIEW